MRRKRLEYEARQKAIRDHDIMMKTAKRLGLEAGIAEGRERELQREENKKNAILFVKCCRITFPIIKLNNIQEQQNKEISEEKSRLF